MCPFLSMSFLLPDMFSVKDSYESILCITLWTIKLEKMTTQTSQEEALDGNNIAVLAQVVNSGQL